MRKGERSREERFCVTCFKSSLDSLYNYLFKELKEVQNGKGLRERK